MQEIKPRLLILATSTAQKAVEWRAIFESLKLPVIAVSAFELTASFNFADELAGNALGNANAKISKTESIRNSCKKEGTYQNAALKTICKRHNVAFNLNEIEIFTDDNTFRVMDEEVWKKLRPKLSPFVAEGMLKLAEAEGTGPGSETGQIMSIIGWTELFNLIRVAAIEAGYGNDRRVEIENSVALALRPIVEVPGAEAHAGGAFTVQAKRDLSLYTPDGIETSLQEPAGELRRVQHFLTSPYSPDSLSEDGMTDYINKSVKGSAARAMVEKLFNLDLQWDALPTGDYHRLHDLPPDDLTIAVPVGGGAHPGLINQLEKKGYKVKLPFPKDDIISNAYQIVSQVGKNVEGVDAIILPPFDPDNEAERIHVLHQIEALKVDKQLNAAMLNVPIIVMNENGCYDGMEALGKQLAERGMTKNFDHYGVYDIPNPVMAAEVTYKRDGYFHIVSGTDYGQLEQAVLEVAGASFEHYRRTLIPSEKNELVVQGEKPPEGMYKVSFFCSAGYDGIKLNHDAHAYGRFLGENGYGLMDGGMDRHTGGYLLEGYTEGRKQNPGQPAWFGACSTPVIIDAETDKGCFSKLIDYTETNIDINQRKAHLIKHPDPVLTPQLLVVAPGGDGSSEEMLAILDIKMQAPHLLQNTPMVIYSPDLHALPGASTTPKPFWEQGMKTIMGEDFCETILRRHDAFAEKGIYLATDMEELKNLTKTLNFHKEVEKNGIWRQRVGQKSSSYAMIDSGKNPYVGLYR